MDDEERIPTFVKGLDDQMEGGIPVGSICLIAGEAGTMKSSLTYNILFRNAIKNKMDGLYITLEQRKASIMKQMVKLGMGKSLEELVIVDLAEIRREGGYKVGINFDWTSAILNFIKRSKEKYGTKVLVLDSLSALYSLMEFKNPRNDLFRFFDQIQQLDMTALILLEMTGQNRIFGHNGEDFLSDGIIHIEVRHTGDVANLFLSISKMRHTKHPRIYFPLMFERDHFEIITD